MQALRSIPIIVLFALSGCSSPYRHPDYGAQIVVVLQVCMPDSSYSGRSPTAEAVSAGAIKRSQMSAVGLTDSGQQVFVERGDAPEDMIAFVVRSGAAQYVFHMKGFDPKQGEWTQWREADFVSSEPMLSHRILRHRSLPGSPPEESAPRARFTSMRFDAYLGSYVKKGRPLWQVPSC